MVADTAVGVQSVEKRTQYTALWTANVEDVGYGEMGTTLTLCTWSDRKTPIQQVVTESPSLEGGGGHSRGSKEGCSR